MQVEAEKREIETEGHLKLMANKETVSSNYWWATTCMALRSLAVHCKRVQTSAGSCSKAPARTPASSRHWQQGLPHQRLVMLRMAFCHT